MYHVVFAEPENREARDLAADALEQLGYQAESATWRNAYLYGARELRQGVLQLPPRPILSPDLLAAVTTSTFFDFLGVRLNDEAVAGRGFRMNWRFEDSGERLLLNLENSTLTHLMGREANDAVATITTTRPVLVALCVGQTTVAEAQDAGALSVDGDASALTMLFDVLDDFPLQFDILTPGPA